MPLAAGADTLGAAVAMAEAFGEFTVVAANLDEPEDGKPTGEPIDLSFFRDAEDGVNQLDRVAEELSAIDWDD